MDYINIPPSHKLNTANAQDTNRVSNAMSLVDNRPKAVAQFKKNNSDGVIQLGQRKKKKNNAKPKKQPKKEVKAKVKVNAKESKKMLNKLKVKHGLTTDDQLVKHLNKGNKKPTYKQETDPTLKPFIGKGKKFVGQAAADEQMKNKTPLASSVRVDAVDIKGDDATGGAGLHEIIPTSYRGEVLGDTDLIGMQSGMRSSTAHTLLSHKHYDGSSDLGGHSGFFTGNKGTRGQAAAHNYLREGVDGINKTPGMHRDHKINEMLVRHLETIPHGQEILASGYIEGLTPKAYAGPMEEKSSGSRPNVIDMTKKIHRSRERVKRRTRALKRASNRGRSPSPPRKPINSDGSGGEYYSKGARKAYEVEELPNFAAEPGVAYSEAANKSAWATAPMRDGFNE